MRKIFVLVSGADRFRDLCLPCDDRIIAKHTDDPFPRLPSPLDEQATQIFQTADAIAE